jgi:ribonuclease/clavin/mitogillin
MNSLKKIKEFNAEIIYPGHGPVVKNALERIDTYINHRNQRNEQILEVLKHSDKPIDAEQIATKIYTVSFIAR